MPRDLDPDLLALAGSVADASLAYLDTLAEVASGAHPDAAIALLLLATSDLAAHGARLGAIVDVVPGHRFEPDDGDPVDLEPVRTALANHLSGMDDYTDVADPLLGGDTEPASLTNDLADIGVALATGLAHYQQGHAAEALWWWQFSYLSHWGDRALAATRVLLSITSHLRLDVDDATARAAERAALANPVPANPAAADPAPGD